HAGTTSAPSPHGVPPVLLAAVAAVAALTATLSPAWQAEASAPGGAVAGAMIVLAALALAQRVHDASIRPVALVVGLAVSHDPFVLVAVLAAVVPWLLAAKKGDVVDAAIAFGLGLAPFAIGIAAAQRVPELALMTKAFTV